MNRRVVAASLAALLAVASPAVAMFAMVPADRIDEVPIERLLANLEANAQKLSPAEMWRAIGRVHLLAYLKQTVRLPVYRERPETVAEGSIGDCATLDAQTMGRGTRDNFPKAKPGERCEARTYTLGPRREIPSDAKADKAPGNVHLRAAIGAYQRARGLEPRNLRTRVALAFAYDQSARPASARQELRFTLREGLKLIPLPSVAGERASDWETHAVLSEAVEHFGRIARDRADKRLVRIVRARLEASPPAMYVTPIVVPLVASAGFDTLVDRTSKVSFDFSGQGLKRRAGWLAPGGAWLVWDPEDHQQIASGFQLFGSVTWVASWDNGYKALGSLDDNGDGRISGGELKGLSLWQDTNGNGVSDAGEVKPVAAHGLVSLDYNHQRTSPEYWTSPAGATFANGEVRPTFDWQLSTGLSVARVR